MKKLAKFAGIVVVLVVAYTAYTTGAISYVQIGAGVIGLAFALV